MMKSFVDPKEVREGTSISTDDDTTALFTHYIKWCVGIAISATKGKTVCRHLQHVLYVNWSGHEGELKKQLEELKAFVKSLGNLEDYDDLNVVLASSESFTGGGKLSESEKLVFETIKETFAAKKQNNPEFSIPLHRSLNMIVKPDGGIVVDNIEYLKECVPPRHKSYYNPVSVLK